ncbi:MAG: hypothetical protein Q9N67_08425 [Ghiorsea sp.]|nr:hypothetical protein [Ghiorsea sp.]
MRNFYIVGLVVLFLSGCASYSSNFQRIELLLAQQNPQQALLELEKNPATGTDKVLYLMDKAMLQRMSGLYVESNTTFEEVKKLIQSLKGTSLLEQAGALTINDSAMSYEGEDYEQVAIHIYEALNYIALGQLDEARVEALQVDLLLQAKATDENSFVEHAFSRYLTGLIYEAGGELDDALIAYRKAEQAYEKGRKNLKVHTPTYLKKDLLRLTKKLGLLNEYKAYQTKFALNIDTPVDARNMGDVVLILHTGLAPIKRSQSLLVHTDDGVPIRISMPVYESRTTNIAGATLMVGEYTSQAELVDSIDANARVSLESHKGEMMARLIARAVAKAAISNQAQKQGGELAGFLVDVVAMATETADTRSWLTLPKSILLARLRLKEGVYPLRIELVGRKRESLLMLDLGQVHVKKGKLVFVEKMYVSSPVRVQ